MPYLPKRADCAPITCGLLADVVSSTDFLTLRRSLGTCQPLLIACGGTWYPYPSLRCRSRTHAHVLYSTEQHRSENAAWVRPSLACCCRLTLTTLAPRYWTLLLPCGAPLLLCWSLGPGTLWSRWGGT